MGVWSNLKAKIFLQILINEYFFYKSEFKMKMKPRCKNWLFCGKSAQFMVSEATTKTLMFDWMEPGWIACKKCAVHST